MTAPYNGTVSKKPDVHVVKHPRGWAAKRAGAKRASKVFDTQKAAAEYAHEVAKKDGVERVIHGRDGRIRDKDSYGNDPNPPKDKEH